MVGFVWFRIKFLMIRIIVLAYTCDSVSMSEHSMVKLFEMCCCCLSELRRQSIMLTRMFWNDSRYVDDWGGESKCIPKMALPMSLSERNP